MIFNTDGPAYRVHTQRLVIRCWQPEDAPLLKASIDENLDHLRPQMPWAMNEPTDLQTKKSSPSVSSAVSLIWGRTSLMGFLI